MNEKCIGGDNVILQQSYCVDNYNMVAQGTPRCKVFLEPKAQDAHKVQALVK
uniref:Uncharacterized protein n=1 Tax=Vitis vinifera TaxID=29760 RepID=F6GZJ5_VITVI